jgi:hypothetical protein
MIEHVYADESVGIEYEVGDLVRRKVRGLLSSVGDWGQVERINHSKKDKPCWHTADLIVRLSGFRWSEDSMPYTHGLPWDFEPFELPEANMDWKKLTPEHRVLLLRRPGGGGSFIAVKNGESSVLCWGSLDARTAQRRLTAKAKVVDRPFPKRVCPFIEEVLFS